MTQKHKLISMILTLAIVLSLAAAAAVPAAAAEGERFLIGDVDQNGVININDVTMVQRILAKSATADERAVTAADVDRKNGVKINDATLIQYFCASREYEGSCCGYPVQDGKLIDLCRFEIQDRLGLDSITFTAWDKKTNELSGVRILSTEDGEYGTVYQILLPADTYMLKGMIADDPYHTLYLWDVDPEYSARYAIVKASYNPSDYVFEDLVRHIPDEDYEFLFSDGLEWGANGGIYLYAFDEDDNGLSGIWPGMPVTEYFVNDYGMRVYRVTVPRLADGAILSNGSGEMTLTIRDFDPAGGGYYVIASFTELDGGIEKYRPIPWDCVI